MPVCNKNKKIILSNVSAKNCQFYSIKIDVHTHELCHKKKRASGFPTRSDTNRSVQPQKMARSLNFGFKRKRNCREAKALISCAIIAQLICSFVFAYPVFS